MLNGEYKNLRVEDNFIDTLNQINEKASPPLSPELLEKAQEVRGIINKPTFVDSPNNIILEAFREVVSQDDRYNQSMFKQFEKQVLT